MEGVLLLWRTGHEHADGEGDFNFKKIVNKNIPKDDYGFEYYPQGLFDTLAYLSDNYPGKNIIITENGIKYIPF